MEALIGWLLIGGICFGIYKLVMAMGLRTYLRNQEIDAKAAREEAFMEPHHEVRGQQLAELRESVPSTAPARMRATIRVNPITVMVKVEKGRSFEMIENTHYAVDMILEFSERDRAVIHENQLDQVSFEDRPTFSNAQILNRLADFDEEYNALSRTREAEAFQRAMMDQDRPTFEGLQRKRTKITIGDYMDSPYSREFDTLPEAQEYSDLLKAKILPRLRELLDKRADTRSSETIEF